MPVLLPDPCPVPLAQAALLQHRLEEVSPPRLHGKDMKMADARLAKELDDALIVLSTYDEGPDLVLYYKYLLVLLGDKDFTLHFNPTDELTPSQAGFAEAQLNAFLQWWENWPGKDA